MVKGGIIKTILIFVTLFLVCSLVRGSNARTKDMLTYNDLGSVYFYPQNNLTVPFFSNPQQVPKEIKQPNQSILTCPDDISTYTDINTCNAFISGNLSPVFDEKMVVRLTWEMTGATTGASPSQGINLITDYTFEEGTTVITYTATETDGSTTSCSFTVTISDNQVPRLENMPANITVSADENECFARVTWNEPTAADNCTPTGEILLEKSTRLNDAVGQDNPGSRFPVGVTTVSYRAYDAMGNTSVERSFTVTVEDREPPVFQLPENKTIDCGTEIPPPWPSLQQVVADGGYATDNCAIQPNSFHLSSETASSETCPYILTRIYEISDIHGNTTTAQHSIVVEGEGPETKMKEEVVPLKSGMADYTATQSGPWSNPATWGGSGPPVSGDNVTIPSGITVTVDGLSACNNIVLNGGLNHSGATTLQVYGNWTNNGTYTGGTGTIEFTGSNPATIGGSSTTTFERFILSKTPNTNVVGVTGNVQIDGDLTTDVLFTSGLLEIGSGGNINFIGNAGFTIGENAGIVISGGIFSTGDFSIDNKGLIQIDSGTLTFGTSSGNSVVIRSSGTLDINGGTVNVAGRLEVSGGTADISDGIINLNTKGNGSSSIATLDLSSTSVFNMTGGTINFLNSNSTGYSDLSVLSGGAKNFGGTLNFGTGSPATYKISSQIAFPAFTTAANTDIVYRIPVSSDGTYNFPLTTSGGIPIPTAVSVNGSAYNNAYIEVATFDEAHPNNANISNPLNRYWTIITSGITSPVYTVTAAYHSNDISGSISGFIVANYTGSAWNETGNATVGGGTISITGITQENFEFTALSEPTVTASATHETICYGSSSTLTANTSGDPVFSYSWTPSTGLSATNIANPVASPAITTTYTIMVTDGNGFTATDDILITVNPIPNITAAPESQTICSGETTNIVLSSNVPGTTFNWTVVQSGVSGATNDDGSTIAQILTATGSTPGTATYTITPTANGCDGAPVTVTVTVNTPPAFTTCPATPITITTDAGLCTAIASYTVTATGTPAPTYSYHFSGATSGSGNGTGSDSTFGVGTTTVTVTATNSCGDANCIFTVVVTDNQPPVITCPANISVNNSPGYCYATPATVNLIYATATDNCNLAPTVSGVRSDGQPLNANYPVGTTTITWTANDGSNTSTCTQTVTVVDSEAPTFTVPGPVTINAGPDCSPDISPTQTGNVTVKSDNCTASTNLVSSYDDATPVAGSCLGNYTITRTWTVTDAAGNTSSKEQLITIQDITKPILTVPSDVVIQCGSSTDPSVTGQATATDNCDGTPDITYTDSTSSPGCTYTIYRKWTATDECGNSSVATQSIIISDTDAPDISCPGNYSVNTPSDIPVIDTSIIVASDNCDASPRIEFISETFTGLLDKAGFCPSSVTRTFRATDLCGNQSTCSYTITVLDRSDCGPCQEGAVPFYPIDLSDSPTAADTIYDVTRHKNGYCCDTHQDNCISFNILLDEDAIGLEITVLEGAAPSPQDWDIDCEDVELVDDNICVPGDGEFHLFTYCKPGNNENDYVFTSITGATTPSEGEITTRISCNQQLSVSGVTNPSWNSIYPGNRGDYNGYLDLTDPYNPVFTAPAGSPGEIRYEVCGDLTESTCGATSDCDVVTVFVKDSIGIELNINPDMVCSDSPVVLTPSITPLGGNYTLEWYSGYDGSGTLLHTGGTVTLNSAGAYSVVVTDVQEGIPCSEKTFNFDIVYDHTGPTVQEPPAPLQIICNDPNASGIIQNWLNSATATFIDADGTVHNFIPDNDFDFNNLTMSCNDTLPVTFTAIDQCSNDSTRTSYIIVIDTIAPVITCPPATSNLAADLDSCHLSEVVIEAPVVSDDCDTDVAVTWRKTGATSGTGAGTVTGPFNVGETTVTYTATDDCGNQDSCVQLVTVIDIQPPNIVCPPNVTATAEPPGCELEVFTIADPVVTENCGDYSLTWKKTGATVAADSGNVNHTVFIAGVTTVTYYVTDEAGNSDSCSFTVTINDTIPPTIIDCPDDVTAYVTAGNCDIDITAPAPVVQDSCQNIVTIINDSPYRISDTDASGTYPVGVTEVTWTFTDIWGNDTTCTQIVTVIDTIPPQIVCPPDITEFADFGEVYASGIAPADPVVTDNCVTMGMDTTWVMVPPAEYVSEYNPAELSGTGIFNSTDTFYLGVTTITYTVEDAAGLTDECSFTIKVEARPEIKCAPDTTVYANANCIHPFDPGVPTLLQGAQPITWTWKMTGATTDPGGTSTGVSPEPIGIYNFNLGTTTITWTAANAAGTDTCEQIITVIDTIPPVIAPLPAFEDCVENLFLAVYTGNADELAYNPDYPHVYPTGSPDGGGDYFLFVAGEDTRLDLDLTEITDNCCTAEADSIRWTIDFTGTEPPVSGTGQPSAYGSDIKLWGDGVTFQSRTHTITYWITDCNGRESQPVFRAIIVKPRPNIIKMN